MDMRQVIEPSAAAWAAQYGTDEAHGEIEDAQKRMEAETGSVEDFAVADALFHRAVLRAENNEFLTGF